MGLALAVQHHRRRRSGYRVGFARRYRVDHENRGGNSGSDAPIRLDSCDWHVMPYGIGQRSHTLSGCRVLRALVCAAEHGIQLVHATACLVRSQGVVCRTKPSSRFQPFCVLVAFVRVVLHWYCN